MWSIMPFLLGFAVLVTVATRLVMVPPSLKWLRRRHPEQADVLAEQLLDKEYGKQWRD